MRILAISDEVDSRLYSAGVRQRLARPDLILGCGDLPAYYLDFLVSQLDAPLLAVHGNHDAPPDQDDHSQFDHVGAIWIGGRVVRSHGLLIAGFDGSLRYNDGPYQSSQRQMHLAVRRLAPWLWLNRLRYGRFLDILVTHAPPLGIHDQPDRAHQGFAAFRWFIQTFRPRYHLHGHIHLYDRRRITRSRLGSTEVLNVFPYREFELDLGARG